MLRKIVTIMLCAGMTFTAGMPSVSAAAEPAQDAATTATAAATTTAEPAQDAATTTTATPAAAEPAAAEPAQDAAPGDAAVVTTTEDGQEVVVAKDLDDLDGAMEDSDPEESKDLKAFEYKKLMVFLEEGALRETYGATNAVYFAPLEQYILQYEDPASTRDAYRALVKEYGKAKVVVSLPLEIEMEEDWSQTQTSVTPENSVSWGNDVMGLDTLRDKVNRTGASGSLVVAVLDTGVRPTHYLVKDRLSPKSFAVRGYEAAGAIPYYDNSGHGTHVAGIVADGTSDQVKIMAVKVADQNGNGDFSGVLVGMEEAAKRGAKIINMSFGADRTTTGLGMTDTQFQATLEKCENSINRICRRYDCVAVVSAGNGRNHKGQDIEKTQAFPAGFEEMITVGAIDLNKRAAEFSNYGNSVDFGAPGVDVVSGWNTDDTVLRVAKGTSMASPHVAAAAAMVRLQNPRLSRTETEDVLKLCAVDIGAKGRDKRTGYGLITLGGNSLPNQFNLKDGLCSVQKEITYTGRKLKPVVTMTLRGRKLTAGKEFSATYSGNLRPGKGKVVIKGKGRYKGTLVRYFRILPKGTRLTKAVLWKHALTVKWRKQQKEISGYQLQLCPSAQFRSKVRTVNVAGKGKTKVKIRKLKSGKRYYVRIRTFKKTRSGKIYSGWSGIGYVSTLR